MRVLAVIVGLAIAASSCATANESVVPPTTSESSLPTALIRGEPCGPQESCDVEIALSGVTYWSYEKIPSSRLGDVIAVASGEFSDGISIRSIIGADSAIEIAVVGEHVMAYRQKPFVEIAGPLMRAGVPPDLDGDFMLSEVGGELELVDGCLHASGELIYWPYGTEWDEETQELSFANGAVARLGDTVIGGGGGWDASRDKGRWGPEVDAFIDKCVGYTSTLSSMNPNPGVQSFDPLPSFLFQHDPIPISGPTQTPEQTEALDQADVPAGTVILVPTTPLNETQTGEIRILDVMRGSFSQQEVTYILLGANSTSIQLSSGTLCAGDDVETLKLRNSPQACRNTTNNVVEWVENGQWYRANGRADSAEFLSWLERLTPVELGISGPPYDTPYCSERPWRCVE